MTDSVISGNVVTATTTTGKAQVLGAGLLSETDLTLARVLITGNKGVATGNGGTAVGGGIATGPLVIGPDEALPERPAPRWHDGHRQRALRLSRSRAERRWHLLGGAGVAQPSVVAANRPDQCVGCGSSPAQHIVGPWHFTWPHDRSHLVTAAPLI